MIIKLRSKRYGEHVHDKVFMGEDAEHLQYVGTLITDVGQWQELGAVMKLGAKKTRGRVKVILEGDKEVVGA